ncbi:MAG TPA: homoserine dehydrogenase [Candidatus Limnocylindrales bacterium]|nr:homoserine dehydrogenase [Candidatus Limnocylindrales bacterium]
MTVTDITKSPLRVGLLGLGTVGGAVAARLLDPAWRRDIERQGAQAPQLLAVGVRQPARARAVELPEGIRRTDDLAALVVSPDVDVVVELIGGPSPAGELVERALRAGKSVVTANKALLAERGPELEAVARSSHASLRFEAAVAGGIPVLAPLARDLAANRLSRVRGIVNGTTNFILSAMSAEGRDYADVLADAQARGYAESDPTADVDGHDAVHKLVLLNRLAFGRWVAPLDVPRTGIGAVSRSDVAAAADKGLTIKLVASAHDSGICWVEPCAVSRRSLLGSTDGVTNAVEVTGWPIGRVVFQGPGAGGDPTSSAVLADLLALARGEGSTWGRLPEARRAEVKLASDPGPRFQGYRLLED